MYTIKIHGGLGNQLFQLCFAYNFTDNCIVKLDYSFYDSKMRFPREAYKLTSLLEINNSYFISPNIFSRIHKRFKRTRLSFLTYRFNLLYGNIITDEDSYGFQKKLLKRKSSNVYFDGYWSDYRYIVKGLPIIKEILKNKIDNSILQIDAVIALHIRRGDYASIHRGNGKNNVLSLDYYKRSLDMCRVKLLDKFSIRVYTDDYNWAVSELPLIFPDFNFDFSPVSLSDLESLWSMSQHKYIIGANSTFSLWAYYLNQENILWASFPNKWKISIERKGFNLFITDFHKNVHCINEE